MHRVVGDERNPTPRGAPNGLREPSRGAKIVRYATVRDSYVLLAAPLVKLGRHQEAGVTVARLFEREPTFRSSVRLRGVSVRQHLPTSVQLATTGHSEPRLQKHNGYLRVRKKVT